jgi:hypothetical protein
MGKSSLEILSIAVTGHRFIHYKEKLLQSIRNALSEIIGDYEGHEIFLYSPLAEGGDQLVAQIAGEFKEISLVVPIPFSIEEYLSDFGTEDGKANFRNLLETASRIIELPQVVDHQTAYFQLGNYLVRNCDLLLAIWNGENSGKIGGTSEVVSSARKAGKPVFWIYSDNMKDGIENHLRNQKYVGEIQILNN